MAAVVVVLILVGAAAYFYAYPLASAATVSKNELSYTLYNGNATVASTSATSAAPAPNSVMVDIPSDGGYPFAQYTPQIITVVIGVNNTVVWTSHDQIIHNILTVSGLFSSGDIASGQSYTFTFTQPGTYPYYCSYHPSMAGVVIVKAGQ